MNNLNNGKKKGMIMQKSGRRIMMEKLWVIFVPTYLRRFCMLQEYYRYKGWNSEGIPTRETLDELDLSYVYEEFVRRGLLNEGEEAQAHAAAGEGGAT